MSRPFATPVAASVVVGGILAATGVVYLVATSVQNAFNATVSAAGLLFAAYYILTGAAAIVYYRRGIVGGLGTR